MRRRTASLVIAVLVLMSIAAPVLALSSGIPGHDTFARINEADTAHNAQLLGVASGGIGTCNPSEVAYLRWDLTGITGANIKSARLTLTGISLGTSMTVKAALIEVSDGTWTETGLTWNNISAPPTGAVIQEVTIPVPASGEFTVEYGAAYDTTSSLRDYLAGKAGGWASMAVKMTDCGGLDSPQLLFYDKEGGTAGNPDTLTPGTAPFLSLWDTNAVTLTTFHAADAGPNWPLVAGLVGIVGAALSVSLLLRRRYAVRQPNS